MAAKQPVCKTVYPWLTANLGKRCLAGLTSGDVYALNAAVQLIDLYSHSEDPAVLAAWAVCVRKMQRSMWPFAYHATAHIMNWEDRARLWIEAGLPDDLKVGRCAYEPGGSARA